MDLRIREAQPDDAEAIVNILQSLTFYLKLGFRIVGTAQKQAKIDQKYVDEIIIEKLLEIPEK
jgi:RimJ/RimL family protein N-acetyltransferase